MDLESAFHTMCLEEPWRRPRVRGIQNEKLCSKENQTKIGRPEQWEEGQVKRRLSVESQRKLQRACMSLFFLFSTNVL